MTLDKAMLDQLIGVFSVLDGDISLLFDNSAHEKQQELETLLKQVADTSDRIDSKASGQSHELPHFSIMHNGVNTGISFTGIPGGHEFTSLILSILYANKKGKLPDAGIQARIKGIKGPASIRTMISLSCETCPEVVQALNTFAALNPNISHEMVDGGLVPEEISRLSIQGVPCVLHGDTMIASGKNSLAELLQTMEETFGKGESAAANLGDFDVAIVGGGPAGTTAAIYAARKGQKVALIADKIGGQLQETKSIENLISIIYTEGPELSANIYKHMQEYDIDIFEHRRVENVSNINDSKKQFTLDSGETLSATSLIVATGAKWRELNVPGEKEYLGNGVAFCPHCDGPFYKDKDIAVIGGGNSGVEAAIDLAGIVKSVTVIEFAQELRADQVLLDKLNSLANSKIIKNAQTTRIEGDGSKVNALVYKDRATDQEHSIELAGIFVQIGLVPNSAFIKEQVECTKYGEIVVDEKCRTNVKGVYAAGDVTTVPYKQISVAMGEGAKAALSAFEAAMLA